MSFQQEQQQPATTQNTYPINPGYTEAEIYVQNLTRASVVGGVAGLVLGGPLLAVAAAGGAAYAVTSNGSAEVDAVADAGMSFTQGSFNNSKGFSITPPEENPHTSRQLKGAATVGGITGLVLGGPLLAVAAAGGAVYAATSKGFAGGVVRHCGDAVSDAGVSLKRYNRKHHVVQNIASQVTKGCYWAAKRLQPKATKPSAPSPSNSKTRSRMVV